MSYKCLDTQEKVDAYMERFKGISKDQYLNHIRADLDVRINRLSHTTDEGPESVLQVKAERWLNAKGYPYIHDRSRGKNRPGSILDLHIYLPKGRHVVIEFKDKKGKMSPEQKETYRKILFLGHEIYEVRSFKRFLEIMNEKEQTTQTSPEI